MLRLPWCEEAASGYLCPLETFIDYAIKQVNLDYDKVEQWCKGENIVGKNYIGMKRPKREVKKKEPKFGSDHHVKSDSSAAAAEDMHKPTEL